MIVTCLTLLSLFLATPLRVQAEASPGIALDRGALEGEIDASIRWLRSQQDSETGSYGGVVETARVLLVLAKSHRAYRPSDGPFVAKGLKYLASQRRDDGAVANPGSEREERWLATWWTLRALEALGSAETETGIGARSFLMGTQGQAPATSPKSVDDPNLAPEARSLRLGLAAQRLISLRSPAGAWPDEQEPGMRGSLLATCDALTRLESIRAALKQLEPAKTPGKASPLPPVESPRDRAAREAVGEKARAAQARGREFLLEAQLESGRWGFGGAADPGITAMVATALIEAPRSSERDAALDAALDWLVTFQKDDGSIHAGQLANYVTSASLMALARAGRAEASGERQRVGDRAVIERGRKFLERLQSDEGEGYGSSDPFYGGVGYGGDERPDLSNLQMALEALNEAGAGPEEATFSRALSFLQRCQNRTESNDLELTRDGVTIVSGNDGGAGYAPGDSKAGFIELRDGRRVPRSYGSMTYALLKGYLFAGLPHDDPRVEAAFGWISKNYTLDVNPGFETSSDPVAAYQGLFYYFLTMAKALDLYGADTITDAAGRDHAWRGELQSRLISMQRQDGSWINANAPRWFEGNPVLATSYAMAALGIAQGE